MSKQNNEAKPIPNIKYIPKICKHLVKAGDILYVVPGDGCCGPTVVQPSLSKNLEAELIFHGNALECSL